MKRIVIYTMLACATIAVAWLPPRPRTFDIGAVFYSPARVMARTFDARARSEANAMLLLMQRDSAMANLEPLGPHAFHASSDLPARLDAETRAMLSGPDSVPPHAEAPRIAVSAIVDTLRRWGDVLRRPPAIRARIYYLPPAATDGRTCLTVAAIGPDLLQSIRETPDEQLLGMPWSRASLLGPCEYYHTFGSPSKAVEDWILSGTITQQRTLFGRCAREDLDACIGLLHPAVRSPWGVTFGIGRGNPLGTLPSFGDLDDEFFQSLIDSLGTDEFQAFWRDDRPIEESFEAAFGIPVANWLHGWTRGRDPQSYTAASPRPTMRLLVLTLATIAGALTWAVVMRSRVLAGARRARK